MNRCSDRLASLAHEILLKESAAEDRCSKSWNQPINHSKHYDQQTSALPTQLPIGAYHSSCTEHKGGESQYPILEFPSNINILRKTSSDNNSVPAPSCQSSIRGSSKMTKTNSFQLLAQRKLFAESQVGRSSFRKLLEPSLLQHPGSAPYIVVLGNVKDKLMKTRRRLELLLEDLPCEHDPMEYYETSDQLLEPLLLCYESLQSCGYCTLADGRLADLIWRVATFGIVLMKLNLHQESGRHSEALDAITRYLDMGEFVSWFWKAFF